jgi:ADP-ribose pyrophosphatase YjhB (NUDIX family)
VVAASSAAAETPVVASLRQVTTKQFPKYQLEGVDFKVLLHTEGNSELVDCMISECVFSSHHFLCNELAEALKNETGSVVVPTYNEGDVQSMVTGAVNFGEAPEAACRREGHEEIGLAMTDDPKFVNEDTVITGFGKKAKVANVTYYVGRMSSEPAPVAVAKGTDDRSQLICCVPIVNDPSDVIARCRLASNDAAGKTVMVIPMSGYLQLLAAFNHVDPRPRASGDSQRGSSGGASGGASGGDRWHGPSSSSSHGSYGASSSSNQRSSYGSYGASSSSNQRSSYGSYGASSSNQRSSYGSYSASSSSHGSYSASSSSQRSSYGASDDSYHPYSKSSSRW